MRRWRIPAVILIVGTAAVAALLIYNQRVQSTIDEQLWIPKPTRITPEIAVLQDYVRIDTSKHNEIDGARFLGALLAKNGIPFEIIESAPGRANLYARIQGTRDNDALLLLSHIDVMPANPAEWSHPPFAAAVKQNLIWGRGTLDMKGIAVCQLEAFIDLARSGRKPERDIIFLAVADEENGGVLGTRWLIEHRPEIFRGVRYALNEGGITETRQERISYFGIEIGTKMICHARLHAASREALQRARIALEPHMTPLDPERILPEVKEFLHDIAPLRIEQHELFDDIERTVGAGKFWLLQHGYRELTQNVMWVGGVEQEAGGFGMPATLFNLPDELPEHRIELLRREVAPFGVTVNVLDLMGPAPITSLRTPMWALLSREIVAEYGGGFRVGSEILVSSYNDSRYLRARGIDAYGVWPFPVDFYQTEGIHGTDERVRADWFMQGVSLMRRVVRSYASGELPPPLN